MMILNAGVLRPTRLLALACYGIYNLDMYVTAMASALDNEGDLTRFYYSSLQTPTCHFKQQAWPVYCFILPDHRSFLSGPL